jgi:hypothetical protein
MNKLNHSQGSSFGKAIHIVIMFTIFTILSIITVEATESEIQLPTQSDVTQNNYKIAQRLLVNTPPLRSLEHHWAEYVASINWVDYMDRTKVNYEIAQQLLVNTPPLKSLEHHWAEYVASINWADYDTAPSSSHSIDCRVAC